MTFDRRNLPDATAFYEEHGLKLTGRGKWRTSPCTGCAQNFQLPDGPLDFFDAQVVRGYIELRTACTERAGAAKPCLKGGA